MKKQLLIIPFIIFLFILLTFFYLLAIERNPSELPSNLLDKKIPKFKTESLLKNERFISSNEFGKEKRSLQLSYDKNLQDSLWEQSKILIN